MSKIVWDKIGERLYETGVDHAVLYVQLADGTYPKGVGWNGITAVSEAPSGAESNKQYADNIPYLNLLSAEEFGATIEALTYPDEFSACNGEVDPADGVYITQQTRAAFGFSYRSIVGNDTEKEKYGYKLHLIYNALAGPSEKARATINETPEAMAMSWEITTTPTEVGKIANVDYKPTAHLIIDSTKVDAVQLAALEEILYGKDATTGETPSEAVDPMLPLPADVIAMFAA